MMIGDHWYRIAHWAGTAVVLVIGMLIAWPEPIAQLLVSADGWEIEGGFAPTQPNKNGVPRSLRDNSDARFWRSWTPDKGSQPGVLRSAPFHLGGVIGVPYNGFAGDPGLSTWLECVDSGARLPLATGRNNTVWSVVLMEPEPTWCDGLARVVAISETSANYVSIGTPYRVSSLSAFKQSPLAALWFVLASWALFAGIVVSVARRFAAALPSPTLCVLLLIGIGLIGYVQFFTFWSSVWLGRLTTFALLVFALQGLRKPTQQTVGVIPATTHAGLYLALRLWLLVAMAAMSIALMVDDGSGMWSANGRFAPAQWSSDNELPPHIGEMLVAGDASRADWMGTWHISDRPPLSYGWHATLRLLGNAITSRNDGRHLSYLYDWAGGIVLNTIWVPVVFLMLAFAGLRQRMAVATVLVCLATPFFLFNSTYIWPKLLSATFGLAAAALLIGLGSTTRLRSDRKGLIAAAALSALALLSHGGSVFGVLGALVLAPYYRGLPRTRDAALAAGVAISLLLPWVAWQHLVDPPGNALMKFAFAGTFGFGEEHIGVFDTIVRSYSSLGWHDWMLSKWHGIQTLVWGRPHGCWVDEGIVASSIGALRLNDFLYVLPSLHFLLAGFVPLFGRTRCWSEAVSRVPLKLVTFALVSLALSWLLAWDCHVNHHQAYQALAALHIGLVIALLHAGGWGKFALACSAGYVLIVWIISPLAQFPRLQPEAMVAAATAILALAVVAWRAHKLPTELTQ